MDKAKRDNTKKIRPSLIPVICLWEILRALEFGAIKYGPSNWIRGLSYVETCDSLERHLMKFKGGENVDADSKCLHMALICCNAIFIMYFILTGRDELDDRGYNVEK